MFSVGTKHAVKDSNNEFDLFCTCPSCERGVIAHVEFHEAKSRNHQRQWPDTIRNGEGLSVDIIPKPKTPAAPELLSDEITNLFIQADASLIANRFDAAAMTFRKTLEVALKQQWPMLTGTLANRINQIAERHEITPGLKDWAHAIRLDGNTAAHETDPVSRDLAQNIRDFTELFLIYTFTLPLMLEQRKANLSS